MKRVVVILAFMALVGISIFGGGKPESDESGEMASQVEEIAFWTSHTPPDSDTLNSMVNQYNNTHPNVQVEFIQVPGSETDVAKLMTAVRGGTGPDVYMLDRFTVAQRAAAGVLEDLSGLIAEKDPNLSAKYIPFAWQETQYKGKVYAFPFDTDARVLYYNKDMIRDAGYDPAIFDPQKGTLTLDEAKEIAFAINKTDNNGNYTQVGFIPYDTEYSQGWHYTWGFVFNGKFADLKAGKVTPTDPGVVKAFQFIKEWAADMGPQKVQTFISTYAPPNNPAEQNAFLIGKVAMMVNGDWMLKNIEQYAPDLNYGITTIPVPEKGDKPATWAGGWSLVTPKGSRHLEAAFDFMSWIAGPEGQKEYTVDTAHLPTYASLLDIDTLYDQNHLFFKEMLANAYSRPPLSVGALYWDKLTQAMNDVTLNQADPRSVLQQVYDEVQPQLEQN